MQVLTLLVSRHPTLAPLMREQRDYMLSSVQKLDAGNRVHTAQERPVVLAVVGRGQVDLKARIIIILGSASCGDELEGSSPLCRP